MRRVLFIDDEFCRVHGAQVFFSEYKPAEVHYLPTYPGAQWLLESGKFDVISLDNDLGDGRDLVRMLLQEYHETPEIFERVWADQVVCIHSMNPVASDRIADLLASVGADVFQYPYGKMLQ